MRIASKFGFFSIVAKEKELHVRARVKQDLELLLEATNIAEPVQVWPSADYRYRVMLSVSIVPDIFQKLAESVGYGNFKSMIAATPSQRVSSRPITRSGV